MSTPFAPPDSPAQPPSTAQNAVSGVITPNATTPQQPYYTTTSQPPQPSAVETFSREDVIAAVEKARQEEKSKLYPRIEEMQQGMSVLQADLQARQQAEEEQRKAEEESRKAAEQERMSAQELVNAQRREFEEMLAARENQWKADLEKERQERETYQATLEKERQFNDLREYARQKVTENQQSIAPELLDWITGNSPEEIDSAVERAKSTTAQLIQNIQGVQPGFPAPPVLADPGQQMARGTSPTAGPTTMDPMSSQLQLTPEQINAMSMEEFAKARPYLLGKQAAPERGLFG